MENLILVRFVIGFLLFSGIIIFAIWRHHYRSGKEAKELRNRIQTAREQILADGKINGPTGKYKSLHWAGKWVNYLRSLPCVPRRYQMSSQEPPRQPRLDE